MTVSIIITTYNWPEALALVIRSVIKQTIQDIELIVADDGSGGETDAVTKRVLVDADFPWKHVKHEDHGIRQARIKNLGVKYATGEYLVFIDHDVVLHPDFLKDHLNLAQPGCFLQGKRAFLSKKQTDGAFLSRQLIAYSPFSKGLENRKNALRMPALGKLLSRPKSFQTSLRGCNLSMRRSDFTAVDGYDETFDQLWGREDSDICYRLFHSGIKIKNLWFSALQYHLFHPSIKNRQRDRLDEELQIIRDTKRSKALIGYSCLSAEGGVVSGSDS
ncbi:MAG: glycosyltransferase [Desulfosarcina sp.]|jgi:glycosyltransferase involved in cell wall biosynthesis